MIDPPDGVAAHGRGPPDHRLAFLAHSARQTAGPPTGPTPAAGPGGWC